MYIKHTVHIPHPIDACVAAVARGPRTWFPDLEDDSSSRVGVKVAGIAVRKRVAVELGSLIKDGSWAEVPISWKATLAKPFFPRFSGKVQLAPVDPTVTRLTLSGMYKPPLGRLGMELDEAVMHSVAEATVREVTESIAHESSPHTEADASVVSMVDSINASLAVPGWMLRTFLRFVHTTRQLIEHSRPIEHVLWIVNWMASSPLSA